MHTGMRSFYVLPPGTLQKLLYSTGSYLMLYHPGTDVSHVAIAGPTDEIKNMIVIQYNMVVARAEAGRIDQEFPKTNQIWLGDVPNKIFFQPGTGEVLCSHAY